ncbi:MAG: hypothetical protein EXS38_04795 [Opitutus sp.]|nr:hypothetical protein [Opitutus sp.]
MNAAEKAIQEAEEAGFDLSLTDSNLALTPEERVLRHEGARELALALSAAGVAHEKSTPAASPAR